MGIVCMVGKKSEFNNTKKSYLCYRNGSYLAEIAMSGMKGSKRTSVLAL